MAPSGREESIHTMVGYPGAALAMSCAACPSSGAAFRVIASREGESQISPAQTPRRRHGRVAVLIR